MRNLKPYLSYMMERKESTKLENHVNLKIVQPCALGKAELIIIFKNVINIIVMLMT